MVGPTLVSQGSKGICFINEKIHTKNSDVSMEIWCTKTHLDISGMSLIDPFDIIP